MNTTARGIQNEFRKNDTVCNRVVSLLSLISNKARFRIVCMLTQGEFCVHDIAEAVGEGKLSHISQQLKILRLAGLVEKRRDDKRVFYRIGDQHIRNVIAFLCSEYLHKKHKS
jgi:DNA-binding transcriptional ArsR family regulator